ncbi:MAG: hypothetical protein ACTHKZ_02705 [Lysobacteraceae bacterium]
MHEIFKGLLFLHGYADAADLVDRHPRPRFGADTAADTFGRPLGNRAASRQWFGPRRSAPRPPAYGACA